MAKTKGSNPPVNEFSYRDADGTDHFLGEFLRSVFREGSISRYNPEEDITGFSQRLLRPGQQGPGSVDQAPIRDNFLSCIALWNSLPENCPVPLPEEPVSSKESVWDAKVEHGVVCSYYDLFLRCCLKWALAHGGAMPDGDCFPCVSLCTCEGVSIGYTTQGMLINEQQTLTVLNPVEGCVYNWGISSGGGSLSVESGLSVVYTAPGSNSQCELNPSIQLSVGEDVCDTLQLAVNAYTANPDYWAYRYVVHEQLAECAFYVRAYVYNCSGDQLFLWANCSGCSGSTLGSCTPCCTDYYYDPPGCWGNWKCNEGSICTMDYALSLCSECADMSCAADDSLDLRSEAHKNLGCCPEGLL